ncbi:MAG: hypothetical protein Q9227_005449 [Pyrenula ochraceoflavens]
MHMLEGSDGEFTLPVPKRQKTAASPAERRDGGSRIFAPFRTIGLVSPTSVPFTSVPLGKTTFQITTSVGRSLQTYDLRRGLNLTFLSHQQTPGNITATHAYRDLVFAAWDGQDGTKGVWVFKRGRVVGVLETPPRSHTLHKILIFGRWIVGSSSESIEVWKTENYEHYTTLNSSAHGRTQQAFSGAISALPTFLNKVFVGRLDGRTEIWNVSTGRLVYTIQPPTPDCGSVLTLEPSPSLSLLAMSFANGTIVLQNVLEDRCLIQLRQKHTLPITSISFRTDGLGAGDDGRIEGIMATASNESGDVTFWDLNDGGKLAGALRSAHEVHPGSKSSGISKIEFLAGQAVLVSSGLDNALRSWIFDASPFSPTPRLLHSRSGHGAPVKTLGFMPVASDGSDATGKWLLSAASDRSLWAFSLRRDGQNAELSQGHVKQKARKMGITSDSTTSTEDLKAAEITNIVSCLNRDGGMGIAGKIPPWCNIRTKNGEESDMSGWESVLTTHKGDKNARTWFWGKKKAGRWAFETDDSTEATSIAISPCGTFAFLGSQGGSLNMFNLQSGLLRLRFPPSLTPAQKKRLRAQYDEEQEHEPLRKAHKGAITGIVIESLNRFVISSSLDGSVRVWDFGTGKLVTEMQPSTSPVTGLRYNPTSDLVSISSDDLCIRLLDIETKRIVRELWGCSGQIYDHCFSSDGRWIIACSMDSVVRIWDLPSGHLIDAFRPESTVTGLAFSGTGEYLATAHAGSFGISLWNNKGLYQQIPATQIMEGDVLDLSSPTVAGTNAVALTRGSGTEQEFSNAPELAPSITKMNADLLALSLVPKSQWQTLLHLEAIRQRNKPVEPPKQPQKAPFFLFSSLTAPEAPEQEPSSITPAEESRIAKLRSLESASTSFTSLLQSFTQTLDPEPAIAYLRSLSPSATDLEIRTLSLDELAPFVLLLSAQLEQAKDFELVNTWMSVFLRLHGDTVDGDQKLKLALADWKSVIEKSGSKVGSMVGYVKGVVDFLRSER